MEFVNKIYSKGRKDFSYPFRVYSLKVEEGEESRVIISVPKKLHKRAVARNYIRRRIREAVRLSRTDFPDLETVHLLIVYASSRKYDYAFIAEHVRMLLSRILPAQTSTYSDETQIDLPSDH